MTGDGAVSLLLWALVGLVGGGTAYRLADRLLESAPEAGATLLPRCPRCGRVQTPLHRLALLRLACPGCGVRPPIEQALVEVVAALLVALLRRQLGDDLATVVPALATLLLIAASLTDLRARLIPNALTYPGTALALAGSALPGGIGLAQAGLGALGAGAWGLLIWRLGRLFYRRGDVFGLGDVKLCFVIGAVVGLVRTPTAMMAGMLIGGVLGLILVVGGRSTRTTMPYGPALAIGAYLTVLLS